MANKCAVIIMEDNESCTVKTVNKRWEVSAVREFQKNKIMVNTLSKR